MFSVTGPGADLVYWTWLALAGIVSLRAAVRYHWTAGACFAWAAYSALRIFAASTPPFSNEDPAWNASLCLSAAAALACAWIVLSVAPSLKTRFFRIFCVVNAGTLFFGEGLLSNRSMSGCFSACLVPFSPIAGTIGALLSRQSQPLALLIVVWGLWFSRRKLYRELAVYVALATTFGLFCLHHSLFTDNGRIRVWISAADFLSANDFWLKGTGLGTFYFIGPFITVSKFGIGYLTMHSDWFQTAFEQGITGFVLTCAVYCVAVVRARTQPLRSSLVVFGLWGVANFPLHNPISALLGAWLLHSALAKAPKDTSTLDPHFRG